MLANDMAVQQEKRKEIDELILESLSTFSQHYKVGDRGFFSLMIC
jgi:hypothetical protein